MATTNISDEKQNYFERVQDLYCSLDKDTAIHGQLTFIAGLNAFLSITAFLGNDLVLVALRRDSSLHPPSKLLLHVFVDRLLALSLGLRYRQVVTLKRTQLMVIVFWVLSAGFTTASLFWKLRIILSYRAIVTSLCLVTSSFSHTKIFFTLRCHQNQVQDHFQQPNQTNQLNIARFRKAVSTALWLQFTLIVCYLPFVISGNLFRKTERSSSYIVALSYAFT